MAFEGDTEITRIVFNEESDHINGGVSKNDFFIDPDVVIVENGLARPKKELLQMVGH